jgi:hypothetical protein
MLGIFWDFGLDGARPSDKTKENVTRAQPRRVGAEFWQQIVRGLAIADFTTTWARFMPPRP